MGSPITWRSIAAPNFSQANGLINSGFNDLANIGSNTIAMGEQAQKQDLARKKEQEQTAANQLLGQVMAAKNGQQVNAVADPSLFAGLGANAGMIAQQMGRQQDYYRQLNNDNVNNEGTKARTAGTKITNQINGAAIPYAADMAKGERDSLFIGNQVKKNEGTWIDAINKAKVDGTYAGIANDNKMVKLRQQELAANNRYRNAALSAKRSGGGGSSGAKVPQLGNILSMSQEWVNRYEAKHGRKPTAQEVKTYAMQKSGNKTEMEGVFKGIDIMMSKPKAEGGSFPALANNVYEAGLKGKTFSDGNILAFRSAIDQTKTANTYTGDDGRIHSVTPAFRKAMDAELAKVMTNSGSSFVQFDQGAGLFGDLAKKVSRTVSTPLAINAKGDKVDANFLGEPKKKNKPKPKNTRKRGYYSSKAPTVFNSRYGY